MTTRPKAPLRLQIEGFFDSATSTVSYLVLDAVSGHCAIIDSVLDYDPKSGRTSTRHAATIVARVRDLKATVQWILETHVHADHLSAASYLKEQLGGTLAIGAQITTVQKAFGSLFNAGPEFGRDGRQFDRLLQDGETFRIGGLDARALHTPGHTPACMTYVVRDGGETAAFVGDTLFMPDYGTARCDFPGGDARTLYRSIQTVLRLPSDAKLYMCHDYQPGGRPVAFVTTVAEQRAHNIHVRDGISSDEFISMRTHRVTTLDLPDVIVLSLSVNIRAGVLLGAEGDRLVYLKIPINVF
jgi:glyoxylase-like metal-dependent hydrolase (beta-lactamase superfamily II)